MTRSVTNVVQYFCFHGNGSASNAIPFLSTIPRAPMDNAPGIPPRNYNYSEIVLLLIEQSKQVKERLQQHAAALHSIDESITRLQQQNALSEQADMQLRQQVTQAMLLASEAQRTARGVGESLDKLREAVEINQVTSSGRYRVAGAIAMVLLIVVILVIAVYIGVHQ